DLGHDIEHPLLAPAELYFTPGQMLERAGQAPRVQFSAAGGPPAILPPPALQLDARAEVPLAPLAGLLRQHPGRTVIGADSPGRRELLQELLRGAGIAFESVDGWQAFLDSTAHVALTTATDVGGLACTDPPLLLLADGELFGHRAQQERRRRHAALD